MDYTDLLSRSWDEMPDPVLLPVGRWEFECKGVSHKEGQGDNSPNFMFVYVPKRPTDDVDEEVLEALAESQGGELDYSGNRIFKRMYYSDGNELRRVRDHMLKHQGFRMPAGSIQDHIDNPKVLSAALNGTTVLAYMEQRAYTTTEGEAREVNELGRVVAVDD